jgi:ribose 5-phosphate isomerase B
MDDIRTIHIGADHAGFELKSEIIRFLELKDYEVIDHGAYELDESDDYPDFILPVAIAVTEDEHSRGIILGGSGQGEAMVANRVQGIRATVFYGEPAMSDESIITLSRHHNDANVLSIGARFVTEEEALEAIDTWLETAFSGEERHMRRIAKIDEIDSMSQDIKDTL